MVLIQLTNSCCGKCGMKEMHNVEHDCMEEIDFYCKECGGCGYIGCDGIRSFLEKHVKGKTNCSNEATFIDEIITTIEETDYYKINHESNYE